jgi:hypothetical protein
MPLRASTIAWLSISPEPERLLPGAVATLVAGGLAPEASIERERERLGRLIRRGRLRAWLAYLNRALELAGARSESGDPEVARARATILELIANHDDLLLGLPGRAAQRAAAERALPAAPVADGAGMRGAMHTNDDRSVR